MNYSLVKPCDNCPFRRGTSMRLAKGRVKEIAGMMMDPQGGTFPCHKTTRFDDEGDTISHRGEVHCAGALIFAEKNGNQTQMMRIMARLGQYDPEALESHYEEVFDTLAEMRRSVTR